MADKRRLQGEIDRCLKKVAEGVEIFEDFWKKVQTATNSNQKEKYESDLKKEIKKLQRLRDQIKTWVANSDIKDKQPLIEQRKVIETQMERFKVLERETKTKAYSKDGLGAAAKLDPQTREKSEMTAWLSSQIEQLKIQLDQLESELESFECTSKKKKMDKETGPRADELKQRRDRHKFHIKHLEMAMRAVDNDAVGIEKIKEIKDDVEYYVEANNEPGFEGNEYLYEELNLEDIGESATALGSSIDGEDHEKLENTTTPCSSSSPSPSPSLNANHSTATEKVEDKERERKRHKSQSDEKKNHTASPLISKSQNPPLKHSALSNSLSSLNNDTSINNHHPLSAATPPLVAYAAAASSQHSASDIKTVVNSVDHITNSIHSSSAPVSGVSSTVSLMSSGNPSVPSAPSPHVNSLGSTTSVGSSSALGISSIQNNRSDIPSVLNGPHSAGSHFILKSSDSLSTLQSIAQQAVTSAGLDVRVSSPAQRTDSSSVFSSSQAPSQPTAPSPDNQSMASTVLTSQTLNVSQVSGSLSSSQQNSAPQTSTIQLNPLLGVAPLGPVTLTKENLYQLQMCEATFHHLPHPSDSERLRHYLPRNPCPTPSYYQQVPPAQADSLDFFSKLSTETLFFIFYYMEGTKAQYLAAKALKKQSWRFHTKYMMWFQRHEEPKSITEDFEQGTYIYFDYEKWGQRKKEGFTFEYRYLEDRDLN